MGRGGGVPDLTPPLIGPSAQGEALKVATPLPLSSRAFPILDAHNVAELFRDWTAIFFSILLFGFFGFGFLRVRAQ